MKSPRHNEGHGRGGDDRGPTGAPARALRESLAERAGRARITRDGAFHRADDTNRTSGSRRSPSIRDRCLRHRRRVPQSSWSRPSRGRIGESVSAAGRWSRPPRSGRSPENRHLGQPPAERQELAERNPRHAVVLVVVAFVDAVLVRRPLIAPIDTTVRTVGGTRPGRSGHALTCRPALFVATSHQSNPNSLKVRCQRRQSSTVSSRSSSNRS